MLNIYKKISNSFLANTVLAAAFIFASGGISQAQSGSCPAEPTCGTCPDDPACPVCTGTPTPSPTPSPTPQPCSLYRFDFNHYQVHGKSSKAHYDLSGANGLSCIGSIAAGSGSAGHLWNTLLNKVGGAANETNYQDNKKYVQCDGKWQSPRSDKHNAHYMIGGGQKAGKKGTLTPGCSNGVLYLNDKCELQVVSDAKDKLQSNQCNLTGSFKVNSEVGTPISLVWSETTEEVPSTLVNFKLNPFSDKQSWLWRGSEALPLIVHDPEHKGNITSASQLFGSWTFGGNGFASLVEGSSKNTPWKDGYEALSLMDKNRDGKVSGAELDDLALWFDKNQDAVSQAGEVVRLSDVGIKTLYYKPDSKEGSTIVASRGFEREVDGKTIVGKSIDWSEQSFEAGFGDLIENLKAGIKASNHGEPVLPGASSDIAKKATANVAGSWAYSLEMPAKGSGIIYFDNSEDGILGLTLSQLEVVGGGDVSKQLIFNHFDVDAKSTEGEKAAIMFTTTSNSGAALKNVATVMSDGLTMMGETTVSGSELAESGTYKYSWKATKIQN